MTNKEKAKAYDEALKKARKKYNSKYHPSEGPSGVYLNNADLEEIFPALKESEDERIRKELIEYLTHRSEVTGFIDEDKDCKRWIAYLEKQKEQAKEPDIRVRYKTRKDCYIEGFENGVKLIKPAEWSEEDKEMLNDIVVFVSGYADKRVVNRWVEFLKSLRPQPKQELSIEKAIQWFKDTFFLQNNSSGRGEDYEISTYDFDSMEEMYESFRKSVIIESQPHWKPSEDEERLINTSISFLKDFADKGYENAVECIDWLKSKLNGNSGK